MCVHPRALKMPDSFGKESYKLVRCGKCVECLKEYQNNWKIRCVEESKNWKFCHFFTLTYNNDHVPTKVLTKVDKFLINPSSFCGVSLPERGYSSPHYHTKGLYYIKSQPYVKSVLTCQKSDVQKWLKRGYNALRRKFKDIDEEHKNIVGYKPKGIIRWFGCAEYGPHGTHRPHYHVLIWSNVDKFEIDFMRQDWSKNYGFVKYDVVRNTSQDYSQVAGYISKYCNKGIFEHLPDVDSDPTFRLFSKGIGLSYVDHMKEYHLGDYIYSHRKKEGELFDEKYIGFVLDNLYYNDGTFRYKLPRYWREKILFDKLLVSDDCLSIEPSDKTTYKSGKFNKKTLFQVQASALLQQRAIDFYNQKLAEIQTEFPDWDFDKASSWSALRELSDFKAREERAFSSLKSYYHKHDFKSFKNEK